MSSLIPEIKLQNPPPPQTDFTFFIPVATEKEWEPFENSWTESPPWFKDTLKRIPALGNKPVDPKDKKVYSIQETIQVSWKKAKKHHAICRALLCLCNQGALISLTLRVQHPNDEDFKKSTSKLSGPAVFPETRSTFHLQKKRESLPDYSTLVKHLVDLLSGDSLENLKGLLVVSGITDCGKSVITRGLVLSFLLKLHAEYIRTKTKRQPHLLTYEDPIERVFISPDIASPLELDWNALQMAQINVTQREKSKDTTGLRQVLQDALRQTPAIVYIGEVRNLDDWAPIFDFAGTGHFIIATTHAANLTETFSRLLKAVKASTPAVKGFFAQNICSVIHLEKLKVQVTVNRKRKTYLIPANTVLPAIWKRSPEAVAALISDGLASILPRLQRDSASLGRYYFAKQLIKPSKQYKVKLIKDAVRSNTVPKGLLTSLIESKALSNRITAEFQLESQRYDLKGD